MDSIESRARAQDNGQKGHGTARMPARRACRLGVPAKRSLYSRAPVIIACVLVAWLSACSRSGKPRPDDAASAHIPAAPPAAAQAAVATPADAPPSITSVTPAEPAATSLPAGVPAAPETTPQPQPAAISVPQPQQGAPFAVAAPSLLGPDRLLVARPFASLSATDRTLGPLHNANRDGPQLSSVKRQIAVLLSAGVLPEELMGAEAIDLGKRLYATALKDAAAKGSLDVRLGASVPTPDGNLSFKFALYSGDARAEGLAILEQTSGTWRVVYLTIDAPSLLVPHPREPGFDPRAVSHKP